jgi:hypothetical protein
LFGAPNNTKRHDAPLQTSRSDVSRQTTLRRYPLHRNRDQARIRGMRRLAPDWTQAGALHAQSKRRTDQMTKTYKYHPLSDMFPLLEGKEYTDFVDDIRKYGLRQDIDVSGGKIIDGRNRARACIEAGVEPRYHERRFKDDEALRAFIISANIHRRHLTKKQKADLVKQLLKQHPEKTCQQISKMVGGAVHRDTILKARKTMEKAGEIKPIIGFRIDAMGRKRATRNREHHKRPAAKTAKAVDQIIENALTAPEPDVLFDQIMAMPDDKRLALVCKVLKVSLSNVAKLSKSERFHYTVDWLGGIHGVAGEPLKGFSFK